MSAEGGHLGWKSGSQDIILKVDHLRTIHAMFALNEALQMSNYNQQYSRKFNIKIMNYPEKNKTKK